MHNGNYTCIARNQAAAVEHQSQLIVRGEEGVTNEGGRREVMWKEKKMKCRGMNLQTQWIQAEIYVSCVICHQMYKFYRENGSKAIGDLFKND